MGREENWKDVFISHASQDKSTYVLPLKHALDAEGVSSWLDAFEITWGDSIVGEVNVALARSDYVLVCLSNHFLDRPWPEAELYSALAIQNGQRRNRILPLILNSKNEILQKYPLLASIEHREWNDDPLVIAKEVKYILDNNAKSASKTLNITVIGPHTGQRHNLSVSRTASVSYLEQLAVSALDVENELKTGEFARFWVRYIIVDVRASDFFISLPRSRCRDLHAVIHTEDGIQCSDRALDRLDDIGFQDGLEIYLYPIEDDTRPLMEVNTLL